MTKKSKKRRKREVNRPQQINSDLECTSERIKQPDGARSDAVGPSDQCRMPFSMPRAKKGKKRRKRKHCLPEKMKSDPGCSPERNKSDEEPVGAISDVVGPSDQCRTPKLEPKHRIFLSHSGAQKDFTWQLCEDLERVHHYPFFDRRADSLPKGEKFPQLILEAARQCCIAVLVLSEEFFTRSKWPMIELNEFVKAHGSNNQGLKILPLFLGITMAQFFDKKRQARWLGKWKEFARTDERIDLEAWKDTLSKIAGGINAMEYTGVGEGEVEFRRKVVGAICKLLSPDVKYDVSGVQSLAQLCEPIKKKLEAVEVSSKFNVKVVGLFGMGGVGKTTISRALCNEMFGEFSGKVCHVDLGGIESQAEMQKRVLRDLTNVDEAILKCDPAKLKSLLRQRLSRQEVFLVLDNVWDNQVEEALEYLKAGYHAKSMVLVISRSIGLLNRLGIEECSCMEMSSLEEEGAMNVLLYHSGKFRDSIVGESEWEIVRRCVKVCCFSRCKNRKLSSNEEWVYHPLALKALGCQLVSTEIKDWDKALKAVDKFNTMEDKNHPVFSILRLGFDALSKDILREIFLDLSFWTYKRFGPNYSVFKRDGKLLDWEWLCTLHSVSKDEMIQHVKTIERKGLLDKVYDITELEFSIHDLYYEFAEAEARAQPFKARRWFLNKEGTDVLEELKDIPPNPFHWPHLKRLMICKSDVKSLKEANLLHCKRLEVLILAFCNELEEIDVTEMKNLKVVVVYECDRLGKLEGFETLTNLEYFHQTTSSSNVKMDLAFGSTKLQVVSLLLWAHRLVHWRHSQICKS